MTRLPYRRLRIVTHALDCAHLWALFAVVFLELVQDESRRFDAEAVLIAQERNAALTV